MRQKVDSEQRQRLEKLHREALEKKKRHPKVNHPGSVDQLEEVWEKVDHLEADQFAPRSFFKLHDINGDDFLDEGELEAIMLKEVSETRPWTSRRDARCFAGGESARRNTRGGSCRETGGNGSHA